MRPHFTILISQYAMLMKGTPYQCKILIIFFQIGIFGAAQFVFQIITCLLCTKFLQPIVLEMGLVLIGALSALGMNVFQAFSDTNWMIYTGRNKNKPQREFVQ